MIGRDDSLLVQMSLKFVHMGPINDKSGSRLPPDALPQFFFISKSEWFVDFIYWWVVFKLQYVYLHAINSF